MRRYPESRLMETLRHDMPAQFNQQRILSKWVNAMGFPKNWPLSKFIALYMKSLAQTT